MCVLDALRAVLFCILAVVEKKFGISTSMTPSRGVRCVRDVLKSEQQKLQAACLTTCASRPYSVVFTVARVRVSS
jgi:hypothetical protein